MRNNKINTLFEESDINPKTLIWIAGIFFFVFIIIISITIYSESKNGKCSRVNIAFYKLNFEGRITKKYINQKNHGARMLIIDSIEKINMHRAQDDVFLFRIEEGDYIIKKKNTLNFTIISKSDTTLYEESIPDCEQFYD